MGYRYPPLKPTNAINLEVFDSLGEFLGYKNIRLCNKVLFLADYLQKLQPTKRDAIFGYLDPGRNSFQHQNLVHISVIDKSQQSHVKYFPIIATTILLVSVFFSIRHCIKATWQNDRDQFYAPYDDAFQDDSEFKNNCLIFMLFHTQNRITTTQGTNHFIPFSETEVKAGERYSSHALLDFLKGKIKEEGDSLFLNAKKENKPLEFSQSALNVFNAGKEIYRYYHLNAKKENKPLEFSQSALNVFNAGKKIYHYYHTKASTNRHYNANASLYDIKEFFQGRNAQGKLNLPAKAKDEYYKQLYANLQDALKDLAKEIQPKVYEYGFLRE